MTEILNKSVASNMQSLVNELVKQATETGMIVNDRKTKEISKIRPCLSILVVHS